jgi:hypothetical protein
MSKNKSPESSRAGYFYYLASQTPNLLCADTSLIPTPNLEILRLAQLFHREEELAEKIADDNAKFDYSDIENVLQVSSQVAKRGYKTDLLETDELLDTDKLYKDANPFEIIVKIISKHSRSKTPYSAYELRVIAALNYLGTIRSQQKNEQN